MLQRSPRQARLVTPIALIGLALAFAAPVIATALSGAVLSVSSDGVLRVQLAHGQQRVALAGVALPPPGHPHRDKARRALGNLVFGKTVQIRPVDSAGTMPPGARVFLGDQDIAASMLSEGHAYVLRNHALASELLRFELDARRRRLGMWQFDSTPAP